MVRIDLSDANPPASGEGFKFEKNAGAAIGGDKGTYKSGILIIEGDAVVFAKSIVHYGSKGEVRLNTDGVKI